MMKRVFAVILAVCLVFVAVPKSALAADGVYFTAVNDMLLPLSDYTMPAYVGGVLYLPDTVFTSNGLGMYSSIFTSGDVAYIYNSSYTLYFDMAQGIAYDSSDNTFDATAMYVNGSLYVPANLVCSLFGMGLSIISTDTAPIVRIVYGAQYSDSTFLGIYGAQLKKAYNDYTGSYEPEPVDPPPTQDDPEDKEDPDDKTDDEEKDPTYENVDVYLSYTDIGDNTGEILDSLDNYGYGACFFVTRDDILENPELVRRIACSGHGIGVLLTEGTYEEYESVSSLLFEAAKAVTVLVSATDDASLQAGEMAANCGLIFYEAGSYYGEDSQSELYEVSAELSITAGTSSHLMFSCTERNSDVSEELMYYLMTNRYSVSVIDETNI